MATRATAATPTVPVEGGRRSRRVQDAPGDLRAHDPCARTPDRLLPAPDLLHRPLQPRPRAVRRDRGCGRDHRRAGRFLDPALVGVPEPRRRRAAARQGQPECPCTDLGGRRRVRRARRRGRRRQAALRALRRLDPDRLAGAAARPVPDHPGGQQPAPPRRALVRGRLPAALLPLGDAWRRRRRSGRCSSPSRSPTSSPSGSRSRSTPGS